MNNSDTKYTLRNKRNGKVVEVQAPSLWIAKDRGARETCKSHQDLRYASEIMALVTEHSRPSANEALKNTNDETKED